MCKPHLREVDAPKVPEHLIAGEGKTRGCCIVVQKLEVELRDPPAHRFIWVSQMDSVSVMIAARVRTRGRVGASIEVAFELAPTSRLTNYPENHVGGHGAGLPNPPPPLDTYLIQFLQDGRSSPHCKHCQNGPEFKFPAIRLPGRSAAAAEVS